jgi:hypothetical protein
VKSRRISLSVGLFVLNWILPIEAGSEDLSGLPDLSGIPRDLSVPPLSDTPPSPGKRVVQSLLDYRGTQVHHTLYLPIDWTPDQKHPVIVEYAGNGGYRNAYGDVSTGKVEDCVLGYGIGGGKDFIWVVLPFVSEDGTENQLLWWGSVERTVQYCKEAVGHICEHWGGDPERLVLCGFSRGAIAGNFIGLHDDEIASLWRGFLCHSHYDGVKEWKYEGSDRESARVRLARLRGRPVFISHEGSTSLTRDYLKEAAPAGNFTFVDLPFRNHSAEWVLRDIPERKILREWVRTTLGMDVGLRE